MSKKHRIWNIRSIPGVHEEIPKREMTYDEESDEIVRRLKTPPAPKYTIEDELAMAIAAEIEKEIDEEILQQLKKLTNKPGQ